MGYDDSAKKDELIGRVYKNEENIDWYDLL